MRTFSVPLLILSLEISVAPLGADTRGEGEGLVWRAVISGHPVGPALIGRDGGYAYAAASDRFLYAWSGGGRALWRYDLRGRPSGRSCVTPDNLVLIERDDGRIVAVNQAGKAVWSRTGGVAAFACSPAGIIYRAEQADGAVEAGETGGAAGSRPTNHQETEGEPLVLTALTLRGMPLWRVELDASGSGNGKAAVTAGPIVGGPRIAVGTAPVGPDGDGSESFGGGLVEIFDVDGLPRGAARLDAAPTALAGTGRGTLLVGTADGTLAEIAQAVIVRSWRVASGRIETVLAAGEDTFFVRTADGAVFRLAGRRVEPVPAPADDADARAVVALEDGTLAWLTVSGDLWEVPVEPGIDKAPRVILPGAVVGGRREPDSRRLSGGGLVVAPNGTAVVTGPGWTVSSTTVSTPPTAPYGHRFGTATGGAAVEGALVPETGGGPPTRTRWGSEPTEPVRGQIRRIYLSRMLLSRDGGDQDRALSETERQIRTGDLRGSYTGIVAELSRFLASDARAVSRAVPLLARISGYRARDVLLQTARSSTDREVRLAVLRALDTLPIDSAGRTANIIHRIVREEARRQADRRLGEAALEAVHAYVSYRGGIDAQAIGNTISLLGSRTFPGEIRSAAAGLARTLY
ncbi:MAG: hypothetical protein ACLFRR_03575 [Spirochaetaceae bacterium]